MLKRLSGLFPNGRGSSWIEPGAVLFLCAATAGFLYWRFSHWYYDDPFITFRYSFNLLAGNGLVYNPGERVLSTTTPFFAILLALLGLLKPSIPRLGVLMGILSLVFSGLVFWGLGRRWKMPWVGWAGLLLLPAFPLVVGTLSSEMPLYIALLLAAIWTYTRRAYGWTAFVCVCLEFVRPDGILLPMVLAINYAWRVRGNPPWKAILWYAALSALGWGLLWLYFGTPLPVTLAAKQGQGAMTISQRFAPGLIDIVRPYATIWYYKVELVLAILGLAWLAYKRSPGLLLVGWTILYFLAYTFLGVTRYAWYYAPLVPGFILLVGAGIQAVAGLGARIRWPALSAGRVTNVILSCLLAALLLLQGAHTYKMSLSPDRRIAIYQQAGEWLNTNTSPGATVGTLEVGIIGYYANRHILDFAGLIQPAVASQMKSDTTYTDTAQWVIQEYHPEYLVLQAGVFPGIENSYAHDHCHVAVQFDANQYQSPWSLVIYRCN